MYLLLLLMFLPGGYMFHIGQDYQFQSVNYPKRLLRHRNFATYIAERGTDQHRYDYDTSFKVVLGLAGSGVSFQSVNYPNRYLRHQSFNVFIHEYDGSALFKQDATFLERSGLDRSGRCNSVSFESYNYPYFFLRHENSRIKISRIQNTDLFKKDASWVPLLRQPELNIGRNYQFQSVNYPLRRFRHRSLEMWLDGSDKNPRVYESDSSFKVVPGLSGSGVSLQSVNYPDRYIVPSDSLVFTRKDDGTDKFKEQASFRVVRGLDTCSGHTSVSFESLSYPTFYLRHQSFRIKLHKHDNTDLFRKDASWVPLHKNPLLNIGKNYAFRSVNFPTHKFRHSSSKMRLDRELNQKLYKCDSTFEIIPGLAGQGVSFRCVNYPTRYIRHQNYIASIHEDDGTELFKKDASFTPVKGLSTPGGKSISFESYNFPTYFLRHQNFNIKISKYENTALFKKDASWTPEFSSAQC